MDQLACACLHEKVNEQIERTNRLVAMLSDEDLDWAPPMEGAWPIGVLIGHLLECFAGFCAVFHAHAPDRLRHFQELRQLPVNHCCGKDEARERMAAYQEYIAEGFASLCDGDLGTRVPTAFVNDGEPLMTLLLGNLEHLINHKHQLFVNLRLKGAPVTSQDLYRFRGQ